jgi:DNA-binding CsgD family transcriptional regulator
MVNGVASALTDSAPTEGQSGLSRLNGAERQVLLLLAEGHTAKSIAGTLGSTEAAVNERLREARRKTGLGSSRELARLLKARENRDESIGMASARRILPIAVASDAEPWRPQTGVLAMIGLFSVAAAGAVVLMSQAPVTGNQVEPLIGAPLERFPQPADLHARVRAEQRDAVWAPRTEEQIRSRVSQIPLIGKGGNVLRVTCSTTLCEIAGTVEAPVSSQEREDQKSAYNLAIRDLQVAPLPDDLAKLGLKSESGTFTGGKGEPDRSVFFLYYSRADAKLK